MKHAENKLTQVVIRGYKSISFEKPVTLDIKDITVLLGANGAGKSNIISFFKMLGYMMSGTFQRFIAQSGTNQQFLYYGPKRTPSISAEIRFDSDKVYDTYRFSLAHAAGGRLIINSEEIEWKDKTKDLVPVKKTLVSDFNESALVNSTDKDCEIIRSILSSCKVYQFNDSTPLSALRQASTVESAHYLQSEANNLASFLYYLKNNYPESYNRIVGYTKEVVPQFRDFYLEPERGYISLNWMDTSVNDYVLTADQFSDGSIRFIALATLLLQPEETMPNVIIIDEPELGLHPYAIAQLIEMIKDASLHAQILVATQSPALIDGFDVSDIAVIERDDIDQCTAVKNLSSDKLSEWLEEYTLSELWDKNVFGGRPL